MSKKNAGAMRERWRTAGLCNTCGGKRLNGYKTCERCRDRFNSYSRRSNQKLKDLVYDHYGRKCACCGETEMLFLSIDHINGDGNKDRLRVGQATTAMYRLIVRNGFPSTFQVLCRNCNWGRHANGGVCPHKS